MQERMLRVDVDDIDDRTLGLFKERRGGSGQKIRRLEIDIQ